MNFLKKYSAWIIILLALIIRLLDGLRVPIYMDEIPLLYNVSHFIGHKTLLPEHFSYPTFFSYLMFFPVVTLFVGYYVIAGYPLSGLMDHQWMQFLFDQKLSLIVFGGRFVSFFLSMLTMIIVYFWAKKRYGLGTGLITVCILGLDPFGGHYVAFSRYALPEMTTAFLVTVGLLLCFEFLVNSQKEYLFFASFLIGLATSTKYNAGMAVIPLVCVPFLAGKERRWNRVLSTWGFFILGFVTGSPGWLIRPHRFIQGYVSVNNLLAMGHVGDQGVDWLWIFAQIWQRDTYVLPIVFLAVGYAIYKHSREDILFLFLVVPSFFYIGQLEKKSIHYFLFLYPILSLFMGRITSVIGQKLRIPIVRQFFIFLCLILFFVNPLFRISKMVYRDMTLDNRIAAERWIQKKIPDESVIIIDPVIFRNLVDEDQALLDIKKFESSGSYYLEEVKSYYENRPLYHIRNIRNYWDHPNSFLENPTDYIVISSSNYHRFFIQDSSQVPDHESLLYRGYQTQKAFYEKIFSEEGHSLRLLKRFSGIAGSEVRIYQKQTSTGNQKLEST